MSTNNRTKLNIVINDWIRGTVKTVTALKRSRITYELIKRYKKSCWIESLGDGAYKLYNDLVEWQGALYAIQEQLELSIHPGGKTSLELQGYSHYLTDKIRQVFLFGYRGEKLPRWFKNHTWQVNIQYTANQLFPENAVVGLTKYKYRDFEITISTPERAILEMLSHFPEYHSFDECYKILENLATLRPQLCQDLLAICQSIKVKRMFLFIAEHVGHSWFENLNPQAIALGTGNRSLVSGGVLNRKYQITVPKEYA
jgi:hypothetical protein